MTDHLEIGGLVFPQMDQADFTGPYEVLSRIPEASFHVLWKKREPVRDLRGLLLTPEVEFAGAPQLDVLLVPGGFGQQALMEDEEVLDFLRRQAAGARYVFSVCTGALTCGAAGLLKGRRATTHWTAWHLLPYFGAVPVKERVVLDGTLLTAAGVTAGLDGALRLAALLRGERAARIIQLYLEYAPEPPFEGTPETAGKEIVGAVRGHGAAIAAARLETARRVSARLGLNGKELRAANERE